MNSYQTLLAIRDAMAADDLGAAEAALNNYSLCIPLEKKGMCGVCGSSLVEIRGKYPNWDKRKVCPTCATERLEQINEISSPNYGQAYLNKNK